MPSHTEIAEQLLQRAKADDYAGFDPFDGLNSRLFEWAPGLGRSWFGLLWLQAHKRSPINLRPWLGVPKMRNPKGVALFILGLLEDYQRSGDFAYLDEAKALGHWLLGATAPRDDWGHCCWGYHFDWKARAFYVPRGKPNIISTIYVARALDALTQHSGEHSFRAAAFDAAEFIVQQLYIEAGGRRFFAYIPGEQAFVHNASLWGAAWVARVGVAEAKPRYVELALEVARQSVAEQQADGAWVYGARDHHQFIDGFHTGYNLEALDMARQVLGLTEFDGAIERGLDYYLGELVEADGTAKYYHDNPFPLDMHSASQLLITLLTVGGDGPDGALAQRVLERAVQTLYLPGQGRFIYQKHRYWANKVDYLRWTQAWAYYALAMYNRKLAAADAAPV